MCDLWSPTGREVAVLCGDLHLTLNPPPARPEKEWLKVEARYLRQLRDLADHFQVGYEPKTVAVVYTGDIFDVWNPTPELINFALKELPPGFSVAGNHDLPNHDYNQIGRSGYWTLAQSGVIRNLWPGQIYGLNDRWDVAGYPWGYRKEAEKTRPGRRTLAVVHDYCWAPGHDHPGVSPLQHYSEYLRRFRDYDAIAVGDNHKGFTIRNDGHPVLFNNGTFLRRRTAEKGYAPRVGVLFGDGTVREVFLDCEEDKFQEVKHSVAEVGVDPDELLKSIRSLADVGLDFKAAVAEWLRRERPLKKVEQYVLKWLEEAENDRDQ